MARRARERIEMLEATLTTACEQLEAHAEFFAETGIFTGKELQVVRDLNAGLRQVLSGRSK